MNDFIIAYIGILILIIGVLCFLFMRAVQRAADCLRIARILYRALNALYNDPLIKYLVSETNPVMINARNALATLEKYRK